MADYAACFARRLRLLRRQSGLTQKELAHFLGFSEKTVSKWECTASVPPVDVLFRIAGFFHTSVENLFQPDVHYFLGIDGGGTKTDLLLTDDRGNEIRSLQASGCNPMDIGFDSAADLLKHAIYDICGDIPLSSVYAFAGIAGGTSAGMQERLRTFFESLHFKAFANDTDNLNSIAIGLGKRDGILVTLGTGICAFIQKDRRLRRIAGWGYLIDNGGSGYNLGRDALNAYFCALDGTAPPTSLTQHIDSILPGGAHQIMAYIYSGGKKAVAAFAPAVFAAIEEQDAIAESILKRNVLAVTHIIETAAKDFGNERIPVVLAGGLTKQPSFLAGIRETIEHPERFVFQVPDRKPVYGAVALARELAEKER